MTICDLRCADNQLSGRYCSARANFDAQQTTLVVVAVHKESTIGGWTSRQMLYCFEIEKTVLP